MQITLKKFGCLKNFLLCERRHAEQMKCKPFSMVMGREVSKYRGRTHVFPRRHGQNPEKINNIPGIMPVFSYVAMSQLVCHPSLSFFCRWITPQILENLLNLQRKHFDPSLASQTPPIYSLTIEGGPGWFCQPIQTKTPSSIEESLIHVQPPKGHLKGYAFDFASEKFDQKMGCPAQVKDQKS